MKRTLLIFLAIFYFGVSQGTTVYFHYCMGELVDLGITNHEKKTCGFCGMKQSNTAKKDCCKDEAKQAKIDQSKTTSLLQVQFEQTSVLVQNNATWQLEDFSFPVKQGKAALSNAPPILQEIPAFIRNCTFRI
ncbi:HYC_CC_PP family protein [Pedobacter sp.]|uniref:HYC_CC_PP family protein n=1 Tax=Pedobacter sp. TaxID=1411316 RepID=UPI003D7FCB54